MFYITSCFNTHFPPNILPAYPGTSVTFYLSSFKRTYWEWVIELGRKVYSAQEANPNKALWLIKAAQQWCSLPKGMTWRTDMIKERHLAAQATEEHKKQFFRNGEPTVKLKFHKVLTLWNTLEWCPGHYDTNFLSPVLVTLIQRVT